MGRSLRVVALCAVSFAAGAVIQRLYDQRAVPTEAGGPPSPAAIDASAPVDFTNQPLWAYGFLQPPAPGERAAPQAAPSRNLRLNEDAVEQTKARRLPGSARRATGQISWVSATSLQLLDARRATLPVSSSTSNRGPEKDPPWSR